MSKMITPLSRDVLLRFRTTSEHNLTEGGIYVKEDDKTTEFEYYDVVSTGPEVEYVSAGDTVIVSWSRMTPPFKFEGHKYGITSEEEIFAVIEKDG